MTEERMDDRLKKELGVARRSRGMEDRQVTENRVVSDDERLEMFRAQLFNDALPDLPEIPGYHLHWMRGTPSRISQALRAGYEWDSESFGGSGGSNWMIALSLRLNLFNGLGDRARLDAAAATLRQREAEREAARKAKEEAAKNDDDEADVLIAPNHGESHG